ncbi:MAG: ABC transporter permease subunit [Candidatus Lokiarchaeota archaeon]|nr:ABC transporter permease subunit [Candidatus Lokiarchaeota archaeon]
MNIFEILVQYRQAFLNGLFVSFKLALSIWVIGLIIGSILGIFAARLSKSVGRITTIIGSIITSIPALVFLFWLHYPLQAALQVVINPFYTAVVALSIINIFGVSSIVRSSIIDFPKQYITAAKVCGLKKSITIRRIILPLIIRQILPGILILQVTMLQSTLFASLISVEEIFRVAQRVNAIVYRPIQIYTALAFLFIALCLPLNLFAFWLNKKYKVLTSDQ